MEEAGNEKKKILCWCVTTQVSCKCCSNGSCCSSIALSIAFHWKQPEAKKISSE